MKKYLLIMAVAAIALTSCSSDETIAVNQSDAINFRAYQTGLTRAADASLAAGSSFKVTAFPTGTTTSAFFSNVVFTGTTSSTTTTFSSANKYYWPSGALDFYAWAPSTEIAATDDYTGFTITPGTTIGSQPDFIYGVTKNKDKSNSSSGVSLNFRHAESKVVINLMNSNNNLLITVGDVTIGNLYGNGTFTWNGCTNGTASATDTDGNSSGYYLDGTWAPGLSGTSYTVTMESTSSYNELNGTTAAKGLTSTAKDYEMILIPQTLTTATEYSTATPGSTFNGAYITVELSIQNKADGNTYLAGGSNPTNYVTAMWPLGPLTWLPGHKYTYIVDLAGGGYYTTNQNSDDDLDPIIAAGSEIKFVNPTIDNWIVTAPAGDQNIAN